MLERKEASGPWDSREFLKVGQAVGGAPDTEIRAGLKAQRCDS